MITALVGTPTRTNLLLAYTWLELGVDARVLSPEETCQELGGGDVALFRLDVLPGLDGMEPGLEHAEHLIDRGVRVLNRPDALLATHDKLATARILEAAGIPHPRTTHVEPGMPLPESRFPAVVKPRFGSWGQDVYLCRTSDDLPAILDAVSRRPWWSLHGALLQELVGAERRDVRVVVAGDRIVAGAQRIAAEGEWRTNVTLGGSVTRAEVPEDAEELALAAARTIGIDFAGVDLLPLGGGWIVLELNGAVDFDRRYALHGEDPFAATLESLGITELARDGKPSVEEMARTEEAMEKTVQGKPVRAGDEIVITGHSVGDAPRTAEILEVLGEPGHERFRVRWEDGHESIFFPAEDATIRRPRARKAAKA
ncbi:MAG TPA: RimK family alpha-L-glutamate ligase [Gaiellaceae bacterium]|nr:RimK family alpha-L-glutamate ligase [Gaiellaceae bacterium]